MKTQYSVTSKFAKSCESAYKEQFPNKVKDCTTPGCVMPQATYSAIGKCILCMEKEAEKIFRRKPNKKKK